MEITKYQLGVVEDLTSSALYMMFNLKKNSDTNFGLKILQRFVDGRSVVAGFGNNLLKMFDITQGENFERAKFKDDKISDNDGFDLVLWLKDNDSGEVFNSAISIRKALEDYFEFKQSVRGFTYRKKYDLSGFEDGIENPQDDAILPTAIVLDGSLEGSSFWVLQQWIHDFDWLNSVSQSQKEECIGRSLDDSHQFERLKDFAHVKRSAKENFSPVAETLRRSMPWADDKLQGGLMFSAFATSFRSFNLQMARMLGADDGVIDGIFQFSKVMETNYLWCPPFKRGRLDLSLFNN